MKNNQIMGEQLPTKSSNQIKDNSNILGFTCLDYVAPYLTQDGTSCTDFSFPRRQSPYLEATSYIGDEGKRSDRITIYPMPPPSYVQFFTFV